MPTTLFCFPFAGGSRYSYNGFLKHAPGFLSLVPLELPGRGSRLTEKLLTDIGQMADDLFLEIRKRLYQPYAFYGHSMGTVLAFMVTQRIAAENLGLPQYLFLSGRGGPSMNNYGPPRSSMPRDEFIESVSELGGSSREILEDESIMSFFEPILRADFKALEDYKYHTTGPMPIPMHIITGTEEQICDDQIAAWQKESLYPVQTQRMNGNHFFIFQHEQQIVEIITAKLNSKKQLFV